MHQPCSARAALPTMISPDCTSTHQTADLLHVSITASIEQKNKTLHALKTFLMDYVLVTIN